MNLPPGWFHQSDIDFYRELISSIPNESYMAEIGVWRGRSLCSIADLIIEKKLIVIAVDTFKGSESEDDLLKQASEIDIKAEFIKNITEFGIFDRTIMLENTSLDAAKFVKDDSLFLAFIDAEHTEEACSNDLEAWIPKVKGVIAGHDFFKEGVNSAVRKRFGDKIRNNKNIWYMIKI